MKLISIFIKMLPFQNNKFINSAIKFKFLKIWQKMDLIFKMSQIGMN